MFEFINITKKFKKDFWSKPFYALDQVSFKVAENGVTGFLGANGAGKTTSLKIMMNFISKNSGQVTFSDRLGKNQKQIFSKIGYLPERPYFYPHLTGREFVFYMGQLNDVPASLIRERTKVWSERFKVDHALERQIKGYSKGMLQRIGFVATLIHDPLFIVLDEPLSGLDPVGRKEIKDVLKELNTRGKTVFFSSHIVGDVEEICREVVVLEHGKLLYQGSIESLIEDNVGTDYEIRYKSQDGFEEMVVSRNDKDAKIKELIQTNHSIEKITQSRKSLEEIIYKIRS